MVRRYDQRKRAERAETTRRRIIEAISALHAEKGIAATSMKHIAERAGVSVGTVYHHFPTYDDAIAACGAHMVDNYPPPDESSFSQHEGARERVAALCSAMYAYYELNPAIEAVRADQYVSPVLRAFLEREQKDRARLASAALCAMTDQSALLTALLDIGVWRALTRAGFSTEAAAQSVTAIVSEGHGILNAAAMPKPSVKPTSRKASS